MAVGAELSADESSAWFPFAGVLEMLPAALNSQLVRDSDLTLFDFFVLAFLRDSPQRTMRVSALAACSSATVPRMSKVAARLESAGYLRRSASAGDGRAVNVTLTDAGAEKVAAAEPAHHQTVRALVLDALTAEQINQLRDIALALVSRLHPDAAIPVDRQPSVLAN